MTERLLYRGAPDATAETRKFLDDPDVLDVAYADGWRRRRVLDPAAPEPVSDALLTLPAAVSTIWPKRKAGR